MSEELKSWTTIQPEGQPYINGAVYADGKRLCVCETIFQAAEVCDAHEASVRAAVMKERGEDAKEGYRNSTVLLLRLRNEVFRMGGMSQQTFEHEYLNDLGDYERKVAKEEGIEL